jgi:hypothetical protein
MATGPHRLGFALASARVGYDALRHGQFSRKSAGCRVTIGRPPASASARTSTVWGEARYMRQDPSPVTSENVLDHPVVRLGPARHDLDTVLDCAGVGELDRLDRMSTASDPGWVS